MAFGLIVVSRIISKKTHIFLIRTDRRSFRPFETIRKVVCFFLLFRLCRNAVVDPLMYLHTHFSHANRSKVLSALRNYSKSCVFFLLFRLCRNAVVDPLMYLHTHFSHTNRSKVLSALRNYSKSCVFFFVVSAVPKRGS